MQGTPIYGYLFKIVVRKGEVSYVAYCPGVGGVYEEGKTRDEAINNAYKAACAILDARARNGHWLVQESDTLKILRRAPSLEAVQQLSQKPTPDEYLATIPS